MDGKLWVYFGTGDRNHPNNTSANRFYGIRDDQTGMTNGRHGPSRALRTPRPASRTSA